MFWREQVTKGRDLAEPADHKQDHHGMNRLLSHVEPRDEQLQLPPQLHAHARCWWLALYKARVAVLPQPVDAEHCGQHALPFGMLRQRYVLPVCLVELLEHGRNAAQEFGVGQIGPGQEALSLCAHHLEGSLRQRHGMPALTD